jgi:hypothetical protein
MFVVLIFAASRLKAVAVEGVGLLLVGDGVCVSVTITGQADPFPSSTVTDTHTFHHSKICL